MCKTNLVVVNFTKAKSQSTCCQRIMAVLAMGLFLLPGLSIAQLHVKENTQITVKSVLSSQEQVNNIGATLQGDGVLVLNGVQQQLHSAADAWLNDLHITQAGELSITSPLHLRGDLMVDRGTLKLIYTVTIGGELQLGPTATVQDSHLIYILKPVPVVRYNHRNDTLLVPHALWAGIINTTAVNSVQVPIIRVQPVTGTVTFLNHAGPQPPLPPPEWV